jgi:hypothetical protein
MAKIVGGLRQIKKAKKTNIEKKDPTENHTVTGRIDANEIAIDPHSVMWKRQNSNFRTLRPVHAGKKRTFRAIKNLPSGVHGILIHRATKTAEKLEEMTSNEIRRAYGDLNETTGGSENIESNNFVFFCDNLLIKILEGIDIDLEMINCALRNYPNFKMTVNANNGKMSNICWRGNGK